MMGREPVFVRLCIRCLKLCLVLLRKPLRPGPMHEAIRECVIELHLLDRTAREPRLYLSGVSLEILFSHPVAEAQ